LKKTNWLKIPEWVDIVKTAHFRELCPADPDWFYIRTASIARRIYLRGGTGIGALRKVYGGANKRGPAPNHFERGSGKIIRYIVQELRRIGVVEDVVVEGKIRGRKISREGRKDLDSIAKRAIKGDKKPKIGQVKK
jgi:small subunit ribosomal protein S19e